MTYSELTNVLLEHEAADADVKRKTLLANERMALTRSFHELLGATTRLEPDDDEIALAAIAYADAHASAERALQEKTPCRHGTPMGHL